MGIALGDSQLISKRPERAKALYEVFQVDSEIVTPTLKASDSLGGLLEWTPWGYNRRASMMSEAIIEAWGRRVAAMSPARP